MGSLYASGQSPVEIQHAIQTTYETKIAIKVQVSESLTQYYRKKIEDPSELNGIGFELVASSPLYPNQDAEKKISKMCRAVKSMGSQSNPSGSIHVHLNAFSAEVARKAGGEILTFLGYTSVNVAWARYQVAIDSMMPA